MSLFSKELCLGGCGGKTSHEREHGGCIINMCRLLTAHGEVAGKGGVHLVLFC